MWWTIVQNLVAWLQADANLASIADSIKPGIPASEDIPEYPAIRVCRGNERGLTLLTKGKSTITLYIYCWEGSDSQEPGDAYALLDALEQKVRTALTGWLLQVEAALKIKMDYEITDVSGDGEMFRPAVGSCLTLVITWNK